MSCGSCWLSCCLPCLPCCCFPTDCCLEGSDAESLLERAQYRMFKLNTQYKNITDELPQNHKIRKNAEFIITLLQTSANKGKPKAKEILDREVEKDSMYGKVAREMGYNGYQPPKVIQPSIVSENSHQRALFTGS